MTAKIKAMPKYKANGMSTIGLEPRRMNMGRDRQRRNEIKLKVLSAVLQFIKLERIPLSMTRKEK